MVKKLNVNNILKILFFVLSGITFYVCDQHVYFFIASLLFLVAGLITPRGKK